MVVTARIAVLTLAGVDVADVLGARVVVIARIWSTEQLAEIR